MTWVALSWPALVLLAYFIGSIPTAYLVTRCLKGEDIRLLGDGNPGAENVARILGPGAGIAVGVLDIAKGALVVFLARGLMDSGAAEMAAGAAAIAGHNWSIFLKGRGGRGAATAVGVLLALIPLLAVPLGLLALVVLYISHSTTKTLAFFFVPLPFLALWPLEYSYSVVLYSIGLPLLVGISHFLSPRTPSPLKGTEGETRL